MGPKNYDLNTKTLSPDTKQVWQCNEWKCYLKLIKLINCINT